MSAAPREPGFLPGQYPIDAYGNGGFRFGDMSHRGSLLALPAGMQAWGVTAPAELTEENFAPVLGQAEAIELLLVGTGTDLVPLGAALVETLRAAGIRCEVMQTGAAARTFNLLLAERRRVAAALIAVA